MPEGDTTAGCLGLNRVNQIVWAGDKVHVTREQEYSCICDAKCGCVLVLKRGNVIKPHFAYPASGKRTGCTGKIPTPEALAHCSAKWLIHDKLAEFSFWNVCGVNHRIGTETQYDALEWMSTVEKKIPGTKRIADVLLENMFTEEVVAIEVLNTHKVDFLKAQECKATNVRIIEVRADSVNAGTRVLNNQWVCEEWDECQKCVEADKRDEQMRALYGEEREEGTNERVELCRQPGQDIIDLGKRTREQREWDGEWCQKIISDVCRKAELAEETANMAREHQVMAGKIARTGCLTCVETNFRYSHCFHNPNPVE